MSFDYLYDFFKKINYRRFLPVILCPVLFLCTSLTTFAYSGYLSNTTSIYWNNSDNRMKPTANYYNSNGGLIYSWNTADSGALNGGIYEISKDTLIQNCHQLRFGVDNTYVDFVYAPDVYKYYFVFTVYSAGDNFTFYPDSVALGQYTCTDGTSNVVYSQTYMNFDGFHFDASDRLGFSVVAELPSNLDNASISNFHFYDYSTGSFATWSYIQPLIISVPVGSSSDGDLAAIVSAIQEQTSSILGVGSEFSGTSFGIFSGNEQLSGFIDDYTEIEQSMYDKFTENQSAVIGNFSGFSWGSLSTAVDWTSDYLNRIYDNSGDFRTMFMYPILAGIALIFIGRQGLTAYVRSRRDK